MSKFLLTLAAVVLTVGTVACQPKSPRVTAEGTTAKVSYGQPSKRGRVIFGATGALETYGKVWRTGANEGTEITFKRDVKFGGQSVKAGTYTLFTIPNATEWTVMLNSKLGQWGAGNHDTKLDVATIKVPAKNDNAEVEKLTLSFKTVGTAEHLVIEWDKTRVEAEIK
jgi:Protein of unknown function (DUF2911)